MYKDNSCKCNNYIYMIFIYILKLSDNKYYIGKTTTVRKTIDNHFLGLESEHTKKYKPLGIISIEIEVTQYDIINTIKRYIYRFGVNNVYSSINYYTNILNISPLLQQTQTKKNIIDIISLNKHSYDPLIDESSTTSSMSSEYDDTQTESDYDYNDGNIDEEDDKKNNINGWNCYCG